MNAVAHDPKPLSQLLCTGCGHESTTSVEYYVHVSRCTEPLTPPITCRSCAWLNWRQTTCVRCGADMPASA